MVTDEDWIRFILKFFNLNVDPKWIQHVKANWNHLTNSPGCGCKFYQPFPNYCNDFLDMKVSTIHHTDANNFGINSD